MQALGEVGKLMNASEGQQISLADPDARSMAISGRSTCIVGYNVQTAVDAKHHMIAAHEVTNAGHDRDQLANMAQLARDAISERQLIALADRGYFEGYEILKCEQAGIATLVPKPMTPQAQLRVASTNATSSTTNVGTNTAAQQGRSPFVGSQPSSTARHYTTTGPPRVPPVRSRASAPRAPIVASPAGSTRLYSA